jgi:uncharacterized protein
LKTLREFIINFGNLKFGKHRYDFEVSDEFFSHFEYSLVKQGKIDVILVIEKQTENLLVFDFHFEGSINLVCDRCLDEYDYPMEKDERLIVKLELKEQESTDEILFLPVESYEIDTSPLIYEYINLALPLKSSCELIDKACNEDMITKLQKLNIQHKEGKDIDPRWEGLKNLKN